VTGVASHEDGGRRKGHFPSPLAGRRSRSGERDRVRGRTSLINLGSVLHLIIGIYDFYSVPVFHPFQTIEFIVNAMD